MSNPTRAPGNPSTRQPDEAGVMSVAGLVCPACTYLNTLEEREGGCCTNCGNEVFTPTIRLTDVPVWSSEWPTDPGWYWFRRRPDKSPECARVFTGGSGAGVHTVYACGGFIYPCGFPDAQWSARIPEPA